MIHCPKCKTPFNPEDQVNLDDMNTLTHDTCNNDPFRIQDAGTYEEMKRDYPFLNIKAVH